MTNTDNFDAEVEQGGDEEFSDTPAEETAPAAAAAAPKKSGGGFVKFLVVLLILAGAGGAGAIKLGLVKSPVDIPGLSPAPVAAAAPASKPVEVASAGTVQPVSGPDAAPPQGAMPGIAPQSGEAAPKDVAPPPGGNAMISPSVPAATIGAEAAPSITPPPMASDAGASPVPGAGAAPAMTAPPPSIAPPDMAMKPPAMTAPPPSMPAVAPPPVEAVAPPPVAPPAAGNPEDAARLQKLDDRITAIETAVNEMKGMKDQIATKADLDAVKASLDKLQQDIASGQKVSAPVATPAAPHVRTKHVKAPAAETGKAPAATAAVHLHHPHGAKVKMAAPGWVLKSAKPGMAWIAEPGSSEIRPVTVGETLKGLGKVTSVSQDSGGHWVVNGTKGQINQ